MYERIRDAIFDELGTKNQGEKADAADREVAQVLANYIYDKSNYRFSEVAVQLRFLAEAIERASKEWPQ